MNKRIKIFYERDGEISKMCFDDDKVGHLALGEIIASSLESHAAYIMITPDDVEELIEETND
jgi:hypothetical protein